MSTERLSTEHFLCYCTVYKSSSILPCYVHDPVSMCDMYIVVNTCTCRFRTGRPELGYSAHFVGNTLVLETMSKSSKKPQTHAVDFSFQSYQWYMLTVVYVHHRLKSSELCCYVNGTAVMTAEVNLPNTDDVSLMVGRTWRVATCGGGGGSIRREGM